MDWGAGSYEVTAAQLAPVSERLLEVTDPQPLMRVLDVACGTGNFAVLAAQEGADVVGVDLAQRLLDVAAQRAEAAGVEVTWERASATELPVADAGFHVVASVFGVIFATPEQAAADELKRVLAPGGQLALACWRTGGPIADALSAAGRTATGHERPPSPWTDEARVRELLAPLEVTTSDETLVFTGDSPEAFNADWFERHPMLLGMRDQVGPERYEAARAASLASLVAGNEARDGTFKGTSPWRLVLATAP